MDPSITQPMKDFMREIVDVGFDSGLLNEGMIQYPGGELMGGRELVADHCWTKVCNVIPSFCPWTASHIAKDLRRRAHNPVQIVELSYARAKTGGGHKMSLWIDVEMGRPIEVEVIVGAVVRVAREHGLKTPLLDYTYALLKGLQVEILQQQEAKKAQATAAGVA
jgi:2-dehydropantoate 2-reductase